MDTHKDWQNIHQSISVPQELDYILSRAIDKGARAIRKRKMIRQTLISIFILFSVFTVTVNISPAFAEQIAQLPGGSRLIQVIYWNREEISGGDVTDGGSIDGIDRNDEVGVEIVTVNLSNYDDEVFNHYEIKYSDYPFSLVLTLSGIRQTAPLSQFTSLKEGSIIAGIYPLLTLDDSSSRFLFLLKESAKVGVEVDRDQERLILTFEGDQGTDLSLNKYSLRTHSYPYEETVGVIEAILRHEFYSHSVRMLVDADGQYFIEEGLYDNEDSANARLSDLGQSGFEFQLYVEERLPHSIPDYK